ncbi:hypothetical protein FRC04_007632 [Tulasnella sp. 424]|nr:hypothetical protein FRC04_007632 [Tulasnella sp. 424]KAG8979065.1 hypothetical protein FRC05_009275 [Tulasnella sp. 425]
MPLLRPQYVMFPKDYKGFAIDGQLYVDRPEGVTETDVWLAEDEYDYFTCKAYQGAKGGKSVKISTPIERFPLLIRAGSIIPTRQSPRRSSPLMKHDPFTITITDNSGTANGQLYLDDGESYPHQKGELVWREFQTAVLGKRRTKGSLVKDVKVEKIKVVGLLKEPKEVYLPPERTRLAWEWDDGSSVLTVRNPSTKIVEDWAFTVKWV